MVKWIVPVLLLSASTARAQNCVNHTDASGNVCTAFTLSKAISNTLPVVTQDGQPIAPNTGSVYQVGQAGGNPAIITLPTDPVNPGHALSATSCSTAVVSDTVPTYGSTTQQAPGSLVQSVSCPVIYSYFTATWVGTLEYDYVSVFQTHCSSGRAGGCHSAYYPVQNGGSGEIATPPPPPPPPPPPSQAVPLNILWVPVAYAGNVADSPANCYGGNCGSVAHSYDISQYQITNTQYAAFLNARAASDPLGLYNANMATDSDNGGIIQSGTSGSFSYYVKSGFENKPVTYVSFYSALRFANWASNGAWDQNGTIGDTETGAYTLLGGTPIPSNATSITRNPSAKVGLPSENEWYKAAYYSPGGVYFAYPFGTNSVPTCAAPTATPNTANCDEVPNGDFVTDVGSYTGSQSPFGTFDQGGNVEEWTEGIVPGSFDTVVRGASWADPPGYMAAASYVAAGSLLSRPPSSSLNTIGFRVVQLAPAPSCGLGPELPLLVLPLLWLRVGRERKRQ